MKIRAGVVSSLNPLHSPDSSHVLHPGSVSNWPKSLSKEEEAHMYFLPWPSLLEASGWNTGSRTISHGSQLDSPRPHTLGYESG